MTIPTRFHLELDRLLANLAGTGAPVASTTEDADGCPCVALTYEASAYAERVSADLAALQVVAGLAVRASWMPTSASPLTHTVCLSFAPSPPAAQPPKAPARKSR